MTEINLHLAADAEKLEKLASGSVLGLSEAKVALPFKYTATSVSSLQFKIIPFHKVDSIIKGWLPEFRAILVTIIKRHLAAEPFKGLMRQNYAPVIRPCWWSAWRHYCFSK
jgi:hypothetical protein